MDFRLLYRLRPALVKSVGNDALTPPLPGGIIQAFLIRRATYRSVCLGAPVCA